MGREIGAALARPGHDQRAGQAKGDAASRRAEEPRASMRACSYKAPTRAEREKPARVHRAEPARVTLRRHVAAAAAGTRSEPELFAELARRGVQVRLRHSTRHPGEVTGYAVALPGNLTHRCYPQRGRERGAAGTPSSGPSTSQVPAGALGLDCAEDRNRSRTNRAGWSAARPSCCVTPVAGSSYGYCDRRVNRRCARGPGARAARRLRAWRRDAGSR